MSWALSDVWTKVRGGVGPQNASRCAESSLGTGVSDVPPAPTRRPGERDRGDGIGGAHAALLSPPPTSSFTIITVVAPFTTPRPLPCPQAAYAGAAMAQELAKEHAPGASEAISTTLASARHNLEPVLSKASEMADPLVARAQEIAAENAPGLRSAFDRAAEAATHAGGYAAEVESRVRSLSPPRRFRRHRQCLCASCLPACAPACLPARRRWLHSARASAPRPRRARMHIPSQTRRRWLARLLGSWAWATTKRR